MEKTEKTAEQLAEDVKKAEGALQAADEKLESAKKELEASPEDGSLKKKVQGLTLAHKNAAEKAEAAQKALKDAQDGVAEKSDAKKETPKDGGDNPKSEDGDGSSDAKKIRIRCRSKTGKPSYFRAGLRFTPVDAEYEVTEDVFEIIKNDPWLDGKPVE